MVDVGHPVDFLECIPQLQAFYGRKCLESFKRPESDLSGGNVDNTQQRQCIVRIREGIQIGENVLHFLAQVELQPAEDAVGDAASHEGFFKDARLRVGAVQDHLIIEWHILCLQLSNGLHGFVSFLPLIGHLMDDHLRAVFPLCPHILFWAVGVHRNHAISAT